MRLLPAAPASRCRRSRVRSDGVEAMTRTAADQPSEGGTEGASSSPSESPPLDLSNCDREPIHIPGAIQPHGLLVVLSEPDLTVLQVSDNAEAVCRLAPDALLG